MGSMFSGNQPGDKHACGLFMQNFPKWVVQQFRNRYPDLTIRITEVGGDAMPGHTTILVHGGKIVN